MDFKTDTFMYLIAFGIMIFVLADSFFFLIRAWWRGKQIGMSASTLRGVALQSAMFSIPASLAIVMTIVLLSGALGIVLPWIRLSVIGSVSYEVPFAITALESVGIKSGLSVEVTDPKAFATAAWVMTTGCIMPLLFVPFATKKIQTSVSKVASKNNGLTSALTGAAFIGMMTAFTAQAITGVGDKAVLGDGAGIMSVTALAISMGTMFLLMKITKKHPNHWLESLSMPIAMFTALIVVMVLGQVLPSDIAAMEWRY